VSDSKLRQALLGTWRLISSQIEVDGTTVKPYGDNPQGYLVYTSDGHVFVQMAARERPVLFGRPARQGSVVLDTTKPGTPLGAAGYAGSFEVRDGQAIHNIEFHLLLPSWSGLVETRTVALDGDRLILSGPRGGQLEWQRVN
jgi:hypothetical protein